jgi:hypothetical protein
MVQLQQRERSALAMRTPGDGTLAPAAPVRDGIMHACSLR